ncbi:MAG: RNA polymerase sigma factor [Bacteroidales bacterium]|jgi:RNA polymerase sigma factor (sigma-70 family)|nr:RNA polymerase sigma factor [Bacteroidales bacterium]
MLQNEFKEMFFPLKDKLFRFAIQFVKREDEAADIVQDTFLKLWVKRKSIKDIRNPETFAMTMVKNASIDKLRKLKTLRIDEIYKDPEYNHTPLDSLTQSETYAQVIEAMKLLSEQQQMLLKLRDIEGYEYNEISEITGFSINNIRVNISRARNSIKERLLKQEQNELVRDRTTA